MKASEHMAKVVGNNLAISTKQTIEIANSIRGKTLQKSKALLKRVITKQEAIPFTRFNRDMAHKPGNIAAGRYPEKAAKVITGLLDAVEANAQNKGLDTESLVIKTIIPNKASRPFRTGRQRRIRTKRTHLEIIVEEQERKETKKPTVKQPEKKETKPVKKEEPKQEIKQEPKTEKKEQKK